MSRELPLIVPGSDDDPLARVRRQTCQDGTTGLSVISHLGCSEVEITELLGPDHDGVARVGPRSHPVQLVLGLSANNIKVLNTETIINNLDISSSSVPNIEEVVLHHDVHPLDQVLVVYLSSSR